MSQWQPTPYETESIGQRKFYFQNDKHTGVEFVSIVDVANTSRDEDILDGAYEDLQAVFPNGAWHEWRLVDTEDNF